MVTKQKRDRNKIIFDILTILRNNGLGLACTTLMCRSNLTTKTREPYFNLFLKEGLMEEKMVGKQKRLIITNKGMQLRTHLFNENLFKEEYLKKEEEITK